MKISSISKICDKSDLSNLPQIEIWDLQEVFLYPRLNFSEPVVAETKGLQNRNMLERSQKMKQDKFVSSPVNITMDLFSAF